MMTRHRLTSMSSEYKSLVAFVRDKGVRVSPRGVPTREIERASFVLESPQRALLVPDVGRRLNVKIAATEAAHLVAGVSSLYQLDAASNGRFSQFSDDGVTLQGAYGPRISSQMLSVVERLKADPDTRQAVALVWRPWDAMGPPSKDVPCTVYFRFSIRDNHLCLDAHMRSSDVWLGVPYDVFMFTRLQLAVAGYLGLPPGRYAHRADSLHLYEKDIEAAERLKTVEDDTPLPVIDSMTFSGERGVWSSYTQSALDAVRHIGRPTWFHDHVPFLHRDELFDPYTRYFVRYT